MPDLGVEEEEKEEEGGRGREGRGDPQPGAAEQRREDRRCHSPLSGGSPPAPGPVLTQLRVPVAAPSQLLQVALQHVREEVAGAQLHRVPAQRLADLRHRDPQQRPGVTLAHPAPWTPPQPSLPLSPPAPPNLSTALESSSRAPAAGKSCPPSPGDRLKAPAARSAPWLSLWQDPEACPHSAAHRVTAAWASRDCGVGKSLSSLFAVEFSLPKT
ncbi:unnamed protein product [Nyctereutes procyonoides]|uniref:(raccoon dog) hypothetical protein n=1 Tax=Nyctereutes procyonoides TaxID=34880 RepID=A0A811YND9_NYCPR|nr:unnamed protein product [Nyctereutes procyonoides]